MLDKQAIFLHNEQAAFYGGVAQRLEHSAHTRGVAGSIPATATIWRVGEVA